jgi:succinate-semialdehyde dehydrogenase/glutarate-semialdehyde dehydrogenase
VHEDIFDEYVEHFVSRAAATVVGSGFAEGVEMGPLANERRPTALASLVEDAVTRGASLRSGGAALPGPGYFFAPTVLTDVPEDARVMQEEPFGPLAIINRVKDLDEAIALANGVPYGLAAYGFTNRADYADRLLEELEAGNVSINTLEASLPETPFGGVKASGFGREGGSEGLHNYMIVKNLSHSMTIV